VVQVSVRSSKAAKTSGPYSPLDLMRNSMPERYYISELIFAEH